MIAICECWLLLYGDYITGIWIEFEESYVFMDESSLVLFLIYAILGIVVSNVHLHFSYLQFDIVYLL